MKAGFAQVDITPPLGTHKIGWLKDIVPSEILDPLHARIATFDDGTTRLGFVQLDVLSVRWTTTEQLRAAIEKRTGFPGAHVMVSATHNHGGPAMANCGDVPRDDAYLARLVDLCTEGFAGAVDSMTEVHLGLAHDHEFQTPHNRRVVRRDGTVQTHRTFEEPMSLYLEGPIDPEVAVLAARSVDTGETLGCLVNFTCHPVHHGGDECFTAGFPGLAARLLHEAGCGVALMLNGACGNINVGNTLEGGQTDMETAGRRYADAARRALEKIDYTDGDWSLASVRETIELPYRQFTDAEMAGTSPGTQRAIDPAIYDRGMPALLERIRTRKTQPAEVQVVRIGNVCYASIPAEYFVEFGLDIKTGTYPRHTLIVGHAGGMVGYVPTEEAFRRGGYETTLGMHSRLAGQAGRMLAETAKRLTSALR